MRLQTATWPESVEAKIQRGCLPLEMCHESVAGSILAAQPI